MTLLYDCMRGILSDSRFDPEQRTAIRIDDPCEFFGFHITVILEPFGYETYRAVCDIIGEIFFGRDLVFGGDTET